MEFSIPVIGLTDTVNSIYTLTISAYKNYQKIYDEDTKNGIDIYAQQEMIKLLKTDIENYKEFIYRVYKRKL